MQIYIQYTILCAWACSNQFNYFMVGHHDWLLNDPEIDLLSYLLLPLAGPEPFTDEENDSLPIDLQYLSDDKEREPDPDLRKMLLESLMKVSNVEKCTILIPYKLHFTYLPVMRRSHTHTHIQPLDLLYNYNDLLHTYASIVIIGYINLQIYYITTELHKKHTHIISAALCN